MLRVITFLLILPCFGVSADVIEEIVVTGSYIESDIPGTQIRRKGDNLLLQVDITNDSREEEQREEEIHATLKKAVEAAQKVNGIELSTASDSGFVIPLTGSNYQIDLQDGDRPDTSKSSFLAKSPIPADVSDGEALVLSLKRFVANLELTGRTEVSVDVNVNVSVVNPQQYRPTIVELIAKDVGSVTAALGEGYKVILEGIDQQVEWAKIGSLDVAIYIPYRYVVVPTSINSYTYLNPDY